MPIYQQPYLPIYRYALYYPISPPVHSVRLDCNRGSYDSSLIYTWAIPYLSGNRITISAISMGSKGIANLRNFSTNRTYRLWRSAMYTIPTIGTPNPENATTWARTAKQIVEQRYAESTRSGTFKGCDAYEDYRELCARDDIDAIMVATPDTGTLYALEGLRNGKDVYGEKPMLIFLPKDKLYREVEKRGAIFQVGSQQRSQTRFRIGAEIAMNGLLGKIETIEIGLPMGHSHPVSKPSIVTKTPKGLDYDFWCGPSEKLPYIFARHHRYWRFHDAFGGGQIMDWIDITTISPIGESAWITADP